MFHFSGSAGTSQYGNVMPFQGQICIPAHRATPLTTYCSFFCLRYVCIVYKVYTLLIRLCFINYSNVLILINLLMRYLNIHNSISGCIKCSFMFHVNLPLYAFQVSIGRYTYCDSHLLSFQINIAEINMQCAIQIIMHLIKIITKEYSSYSSSQSILQIYTYIIFV